MTSMYFDVSAKTTTTDTSAVPIPTTAQASARAAKRSAQLLQSQYNGILAAGLQVTWTTSTTLNATYATDQGAQFNHVAEMVSILTNNSFTNNNATRNWIDISGTPHSMTIAQFKALSTAVATYIDSLAAALQTALASQTAPTWPSATVNINM